MLKNRNSLSYLNNMRRPIRPLSSGSKINKNTRQANQINCIINSLQKNVKQLKTIYQPKDQYRATVSSSKSKTVFRIKKGLKRNPSQINLNHQNVQKNQDKNASDIFEVRNQFLKVNGHATNNIVELYEFYKKNIQKRQKSTRILISMEMSNGGLSISGQNAYNTRGKESLLKHSQLVNTFKETGMRSVKQQSKIQQKNQESSNLEAFYKQSNNEKRNEKKTSILASQLLSKGCYNIMNLANILNSKKYKISKQKLESFQRGNIKQALTHPMKQMENSQENNMNVKNVSKTYDLYAEQEAKKQLNNMKNMFDKQNLTNPKSPEYSMKSEISFKKNKLIENSGKSFQCSSISKQDKDIEKKIFDQSSIKKINEQKASSKLKIDQFTQLTQSPIVKKSNEFITSKYYVQPIPPKRIQKNQNQNSISLKSNSKIIDIDSMQFDL